MIEDHAILLVEDDPADAELTVRALRHAHVSNDIVVARDGVEALDYLFARGAFAGRDARSLPQVEFEPTGASLGLEFPALLPGGPTTIAIELDADAHGTGAVGQGDRVIAEVSGAFAFDTPLVFDWAACP